jgi:ribosome-binding protein aMBF1 (putative translation factor)
MWLVPSTSSDLNMCRDCARNVGKRERSQIRSRVTVLFLSNHSHLLSPKTLISF